jgi:hypothetical protein
VAKFDEGHETALFHARLEAVERKIFWITFTILGLAADFVLPLWWALGATLPICVLSWWIAYRSDWF